MTFVSPLNCGVLQSLQTKTTLPQHWNKWRGCIWLLLLARMRFGLYWEVCIFCFSKDLYDTAQWTQEWGGELATKLQNSPQYFSSIKSTSFFCSFYNPPHSLASSEALPKHTDRGYLHGIYHQTITKNSQETSSNFFPCLLQGFCI